MKILTAAEAKALANENSIDGAMEEIARRITKRAEDGQFELKVRDFEFGNSSLYSGEMSEKQEEIVNQLKLHGYDAKIKTEERQFVDIYLQITW